MTKNLVIPNSDLVKNKIITIKNQPVILDIDVAEIYGVEIKAINQAVKRNPEKFPDGYISIVPVKEVNALRSQIVTIKSKSGVGSHSKYDATAFTEKGLYMLATVLKSKKATETTIQIIETFAKLKEASANITKATLVKGEKEQSGFLEKSGKNTHFYY